MVRSILDETINYPELRKLDDKDRDFDASVYESFILGHDVVIALGQPRYAFIENSIVYYPVYLVKAWEGETSNWSIRGFRRQSAEYNG